MQARCRSDTTPAKENRHVAARLNPPAAPWTLGWGGGPAIRTTSEREYGRRNGQAARLSAASLRAAHPKLGDGRFPLPPWACGAGGGAPAVAGSSPARSTHISPAHTYRKGGGPDGRGTRTQRRPRPAAPGQP